MKIHILNGDALRTQFPPSLSGELIVMRECLVDGDPQGEKLEDLLENRKTFLREAYGTTPQEYQHKTITQIEQIKNIPVGAQVNLWFEDDLFCQVNLWFTAYLLVNYTSVTRVKLVRPTAELQYGFGGMDQQALLKAFKNAGSVGQEGLKQLAQLWHYYQRKDHAAMMSIAAQYQLELPFLPAAIAAEQDREPNGNVPGRPERTIRSLIREMGREKFGPIFQAFNERESIYGFGDLQVKRLFDACLKDV